nr:unnamed protein product [Spirometra erinaceieuropaei]
MLEPVAKTRAISGTCSPCWNQTFVIELESSQSAFFALYRQSTVIAQLELPASVTPCFCILIRKNWNWFAC